MGWLTMPRASLGLHTTAKAYLDAQFTYERELEGGAPEGCRFSRRPAPRTGSIMRPRRR